MKKAAIFDMDGLLFDTERLFQKAWREEAGSIGITLPDVFTTQICGTSGEKQAQIVRDYFPGKDPLEIMKKVQSRVYEQKEIPLKKGTKEILEGMKKQGMLMAVASSSPLPMIRQNLEKTGTGSYFHTIVSGQQVEKGKPEPDIFLLAARETGVDPADCYVFEDSINGILAGQAAGCACIMIPDMVEPNDQARAAAAGIYPDLLTAWAAILAKEV